MKTSKIIAVALAATLFTAGFTSCGDDYDDTALKGQITDLDKRVTTLEEKVKTDIAAIQASINTINGKDFVKSVKEVAGGYEITFSKGTVATIKNGTNGTNGTDGVKGEDGATPILTAAKDDADGQYYWQVNGQPLTDANGNKVPASRTPEIKAVAWAIADGGDGKNYWQIDGNWLLDEADGKILVTADAQPVKFDAVVDEEAGTITFKFKQSGGEDKEYVVNIAKSELVIVESKPLEAVGIMFVDEENAYTVAIPEGWAADKVTVRADVASDDANDTSITRVGSWTSFKVTKAEGVATIKAVPTGYAGSEIAELTVTMTNTDGEKLTGSIFVKMVEKGTVDYSTGAEGAIATALATATEAGTYYKKITVSGVAAMGETDWAALKDYAYATELEIANTNITDVPTNALTGNTVLTSFKGNGSMAGIGDNAFKGCTNLATLATMTTVTAVGSSAFEDCAEITDAGLGTIATLGANAFKGCTALATLPTLTGLTELPAGVFENTALTDVALADVTEIGDNAFKDCGALATVTFGAATKIGASAFEGAVVGDNWTFGGNSLEIGDRAFAGCDFASHTLAFSATSAIRSIGEGVFAGATTTGATVTLYTGSEGEPNVSGTWAGATWATVTIAN